MSDDVQIIVGPMVRELFQPPTRLRLQRTASHPSCIMVAWHRFNTRHDSAQTKRYDDGLDADLHYVVVPQSNVLQRIDSAGRRRRDPMRVRASPKGRSVRTRQLRPG